MSKGSDDILFDHGRIGNPAREVVSLIIAVAFGHFPPLFLTLTNPS